MQPSKRLINKLREVALLSVPVANARVSACLWGNTSQKIWTNNAKTHPALLPFTPWPYLHAESNCLIHHGLANSEGLDLLVIRVLKSGDLSMAKPCNVCTKLIKYAKIKNVYYSDWLGEIQHA